ncbi:peptide ABC transporter substrate-binding protein [Enterococcus nangangensis]|uniref:peptide ABC transporter substrate-binding protein n=1 Tax=Enterococcus nangangensis TaxID=2559926 RepID=UPI0010F7D659|nr:peptide ABC transporter substrate-binding protein [Enterococcus nangangensis]
MQTRKKVLATAGVLLLSTLVLAACGGKKDSDSSTGTSGESKLVNSYNYIFQTDPNSFDYVFSMRNTNSNVYTNFVDGLMENDQYGNVIPALAESYEVSDDGLTYTYHIRDGAKWVDYEGNEKADVLPSDWVTGLKHAADSESETLSIVQSRIAGLDDYVNGKSTDFGTVGVKADDEAGTLTYTLTAAMPYWNDITTYGILYPVSQGALDELGDNFGSPTQDGIWYNGAFLLKNYTASSVLEYEKNPSYWDKDNVFIDDIKLTYFDGKDTNSLFEAFKDGTNAVTPLFPNDPGYADIEKEYGDDITTSLTGGSTFNFQFNLNRGTYEHTSKTSDKQKEDTKKAILNKEFRQSIQFAFDKKNYLAQRYGEDGATVPLRNALIPNGFLAIGDKDYNTVVAEELGALNPVFDGLDLTDGHDAYYNKDTAKELIEKAKEALTAEGVEFPIHLDLPVMQDIEYMVNQAKSFKQSVEESLGADNVVVDLQLEDQDTYQNTGYYATTPDAVDYDLSSASGWGPDYNDPSTYLNIYNSHTGDMTNAIGIFSDVAVEEGAANPSADAIAAVGFEDYDSLLNAANAITDDLDARYTAYAKAEAWLLDAAIQIPVQADGGAARLTKVQPFSGAYGWAGIASNKMKYMKVTDTVISADEYNAAKEKWEAERIKSKEAAAADSSK